MSEVRIIVDHMKLEYSGVFNLNEFFRMVEAWLFERGFEKRTDRNEELVTPTGKFVEWEIRPWKKISDYQRFFIKLRALMYDLKKVSVVKDKKKIELTQGRVLLYFDGYLEHDYEHRWDEAPLLFFFRSLYDKFVYKAYTERFEQRLTFDVHQLYDMTEKFFNMYRYYTPIRRPPHFAH